MFDNVYTSNNLKLSYDCYNMTTNFASSDRR